MPDAIMIEFSTNLVNFQNKHKLNDAEFAGMLAGAAGAFCQIAAIPKDQMNRMVNKCYQAGIANDC